MFRAADMGAMGGGKSSGDSSSSPLQTALTQLQAAITTHEGHMSGSIPTQDASGKPDPSQTTMMDQMKAALTALQSLPASAATTASGSGADYKALLLQLLDLDPATADDAAIQAAFAKEEAEPEDDIEALKTQAASAADLQTQLDAKNAEVTKAYADMEELRKQQAEAQADEILKVYEGQFTDEKSKAAIRSILISDRESGIAILNGLKKDGAAAPSEQTDTAAAAAAAAKDATPPAPKHDPNAQAAPTAEQKAADAETLIATIRKEGKFKDYTAAREEARRQKPELFS